MDSILAAVQCAFCFEPPRRAVMTPCGHTFCYGCLKEWLNTNHSCPTCKQSCVVDDIKRNHMVECIIETLDNAIEKADNELIESVFKVNGPNQQPSSDILSIQNTFSFHLAKVFKEFRDHEVHMEKNYRASRATLANSPCASDESDSANIAALDARYENAKKVLNEDLSAFFANSCPLPSLLPSTVLVIIQRHRQDDHEPTQQQPLPEINLNMRLYPTTIAADVIDMVQKHCETIGQSKSQKLLEETIKFSLRKVSSKDWVEIVDIDIASQQPLFRYSSLKRLDAAYGDVLLVEANIEHCQSQCFATRFKQMQESNKAGRSDNPEVGGKELVTDYYRCDTCNMNWLCEECSIHCHRGHSLSPYMMGHAPSWACCYCSKKKSKTMCRLCT